MALAGEDVPAVSFTGSQAGIITDCSHTDAQILATEFAIDNTLNDVTVSGVLDWQAALSGDWLVTANDMDPWTIDWSALTVDVNGNSIDPLLVEQLFIALAGA